MTADLAIEEILVDIGVGEADAYLLAGKSQTLKRNREGASVFYVPARSFLGDDLFMKKYDDTVLFLRELSAIRILSERQNLSSLPPKIVYAEKQKKLIVTTKIKGQPLTDSIRDVSRVDKVLFAQHSAQYIIIRAIEQLTCLLSSVSMEPSEFVVGCDHTAKSICKRIVNKCSQLRLSTKIARLNDRIDRFIKTVEDSKEIAESEKYCLGYLHGDFSPGNIFVEEGGVHLIDFEEAGYGPKGRDLAYLIYLIQSLTSNYCYVGHRIETLIAELIELFTRLFSVPELLLKLWELEWCLNEIWLLKNRNTNIVSSFAIKKRLGSRIRRIQEILYWATEDELIRGNR